MSQSVVSRTTFDPAKIVRPAVHHLPVYQRQPPPAVKPEREIRLDWNESPYPPSPRVEEALRNALAHNRYPEFDAWSLREALGAYVGAPAEQIIAGAGLDNVIETLLLLLLEPGDRVIISNPTFGVYDVVIKAFGGVTVDVPLTDGFNLDVEGILDAVDDRTKLIIICNPNNPTGNLFSARDIERIIEEAPCLVAVDEAYAEFAGETFLPFMSQAPNLAILRTMSKFAGLAGMRVGYGIFPKELMPYLGRVMPGFCNVSVAATAAATAALADRSYNEQTVSRILANRDALADHLREFPGVEPYPSATNFLLVKLPVENAGSIVQRLAERGVYVRFFGTPAWGLTNCLRVSIGAPEENEIFAAELEHALREAGAEV
ncbi:MAG: histidinol-phosphate transaminase [Thermomicrobiales bacterium]|nr:histidinol-phosphate transaminase [Thermomicrobiales bacterium]